MPNLTIGTAQCSFDTGETYGSVKPTYDTANYVAYSDCVVANKGNEFEIETSQSSLLVSFEEGCQAKIGNAFFILKSAASITLPSNQTVYLCLNINKGNQDGNKADIVLRTQSSIVREDIYGNGIERDLPIYKITTSASGVSQIQDLRKIVGYSYIVSESEYEALTTKEEKAIYDIYED